MKVSPFSVNEAVLKLITNLAENTSQGKKIKKALQADVTTVKGQELLFEVAKTNNWFDDGKEESVIIAEEDGVEGFVTFRDTFSNAISFFWASIEGNHRLIAALCALLKCAPKHGSPICPATRSDEHFFSAKCSGINCDDVLADLHNGKVSDLVTTFATTLHVELLGSKKNATKERPAKVLEQKIFLEYSKMIAGDKHDSSKSTVSSGIIRIAEAFMPAQNDKARPTDGTMYWNRKKIEVTPRMDITEPEQSSYVENPVLQRYVNEPSVDKEPFKDLVQTITFRDEDTNEDIKFPPRLSQQTAILNTSANSVKATMTELIGTNVAKTMGMNEIKRLALLLATGFYDNSTEPKSSLSETLQEKMGITLPALYNPSDQTSIDLTVLHFFVEWILAANMSEDSDLIFKALDNICREMSVFGEDSVKKSLGETS